MTDHTPSGLPQPQTVAAQRLPQAVLDFDMFLNEPDSGEDSASPVREFRHRAYRKWEAALAALSAPAVETVAVQEAKKGKYAGMTNISYLKNKPQDLLDYEALCDIWAEANAVDTVLGDRYRLMSKIAKLRDDMGSRRPAPLPVAPKAEPTDCDICKGNPELCDPHDCGDMHRATPQADSAQPVADRSALTDEQIIAAARTAKAAHWNLTDAGCVLIGRAVLAAMGTPQQAEQGKDGEA